MASKKQTIHKRIIAPVDPTLIQREIDALPAATKLLKSGRFTLFCARAQQISHSLREIGRLRETTFRQVGEGTGHAFDIDRHDSFFVHLFLWDHQRRAIAGAYRMGLSDEILPVYGQKGFYSAGSFEFHRGFFAKLGPAIELGRSFVGEPYQRSFSALFLLWKGIGAFIARHSEYVYLFGPVSMSNDYHPQSRQMLVDYFKTATPAHPLAQYVSPRNNYCPISPDEKAVTTSQTRPLSIKALSKEIGSIEPKARPLPVLLRHYIAMGGEIVDFAIDKQFNDSLDALMVINLLQANQRNLRHYMGRDAFDRYVDFHCNSLTKNPAAVKQAGF